MESLYLCNRYETSGLKYESQIISFMKKELMSVKLLFITVFFLVESNELNKCLLTLQRQKCPSLLATKNVSVWN